MIVPSGSRLIDTLAEKDDDDEKLVFMACEKLGLVILGSKDKGTTKISEGDGDSGGVGGSGSS